MSASVDQLVNDYLSRLSVAAASLPPGRRAELLQEIREHIDSARAAGAAADEATVRTMLDRLGEPEEIVAAAQEETAAPAGPEQVATQPGTGLELAAALLLTVGSFVPVVGWAVGAVLLWGSRRWSTREKLLGTLVVPGGPGVALWLGLYAPGQNCTEIRGPDAMIETYCTGFSFSPWIGVPLLLVLLVAPFIVAGLLYSRARERAAEEPPVMRPYQQVTSPPWGAVEIMTLATLTLGAIAAFFFVYFAAGVVALVGLVLLWASRVWSLNDKVVATIVSLGVVAISVGVGIPVLGLSIGALGAAAYLAIALNRVPSEARH
ncbi:MAG TPA: hypothetical protein VFZ63_15320 [Jiangellaceae bacterium]